MLYQFLFILTSTRQPTSVVLATDTALFSRAVLAHSTNPRDTSPQARFQHPQARFQHRSASSSLLALRCTATWTPGR